MKVHEIKNTLFTEVSKLGNIAFLTSDVAGTLDFEYFNVHSYSKCVLPFVEALKESQPDDYIQKIAKIVDLKFKDKWQKLYDVLIGTDYVPINNYQESETETPNITKTKEGTESNTEDSTLTETPNLTTSKEGSINKSEVISGTETPNITKTKTGNNTDISTTNENVQGTDTSTQKEGTDVTTTGDNQQDNLVYGFNSNVGVGESEKNVNSSSNISGNKEDNTIDINRSNTSEKISSENTQHSINESVKESGTKTTETTKTNEDSTSETTTQSGTKETSIDSTKNKDSTETLKETGTRTYERSGIRGISYQELIEKEVNLKNQYNLFNILYQDVDSIIALMTY